MLPKITRPTTVTNLISTGEEVEIMASTMMDEKTLAIAKEGGKASDILVAICNLLQDSIVRPKLDVRSLPVFDVVKLFVVSRGTSKGTKMQLRYKCNKCGKHFEVEVDLEDIVYGEVPSLELIEVSPTVKIKPRFPTFGSIISMAQKVEAGEIEVGKNVEDDLKFLCSCIDKVYEGEEVTDTKDVSPEEVYDWFITCPESVLYDLEKVATSSPTTTLTVKAECGCGNEHTFVYEDLTDFFQ